MGVLVLTAGSVLTQPSAILAMPQISSCQATEAKLQPPKLNQYPDNGTEDAMQSVMQSLIIVEKNLGVDHPGVVPMLDQLAVLQMNRGHYSQAEEIFLRCLEIQRNAYGPQDPRVAASLNSLAAFYETQGNFPRAEFFYQQSLQVYEDALGPEHLDVAFGLNNLASIYTTKRDFAKAEPLYQRSLKIYKQAAGDNRLKIAASLNNLASLYETQQNFAQAEPLYRESLQILEQVCGAEHADVAISLNNLASLLVSRRNYAQAEPLYRRSLEILEQTWGAKHPNIATIINNLASLELATENLDSAAALYQRSWKIYQTAYGKKHPAVSTSLNNLALVYQTQGKLNLAEKFLSQGLEVEEYNLRQNLMFGTEQDKRMYLATVERSTDLAISLRLQTMQNSPKAANLALTTLFRRKGRVLDVMGQNLEQLRQRLDPSLLSQFDRLVALRSQLAQLTFESELPVQERQEKFEELSEEMQAISTELSLRSVAFEQIYQSVTLAQIQAAIPKDAALVEFVRYHPYQASASNTQRWGDAHYAIAILRTHGQPEWADLGLASELDQSIQAFRQAITDPRLTESEIRNAAQLLEQRLFGPIRPWLRSAHHLLVSPDSQLNLIPFAALVDPQNRYLVQSYEITYLTSGRDLIRMADTSVQSLPAVVLANPDFHQPNSTLKPVSTNALRSADLSTLQVSPLPGTAQEAAAIAALLPQRRLLTGSEATATKIKATKNPRILHLATHGFFLKDIPVTIANETVFRVENPLLRSGLALAGFNDRENGTDDGTLTAYEVAGLDLRGTQLVVLSACETALGEIINGEGVYGLRRAFTLAGARSQLMSLWKVSDVGTRDLMIRLYQGLTQGQGRGEALRQVQLAMLNGQLVPATQEPGSAFNYQHPYYWASFIPIGDWQPLSP